MSDTNTSPAPTETKKMKDIGAFWAKTAIKDGKKFLSGNVILDGKKHKYKKGDSFIITKGMKHGFKPETETLLLSIQTPPIKDKHTGKEDIYF